MVGGDIGVQTEMILDNIAALLEAAGLDFSDVVKTTIYLTDINNFARVNEIYAKRFSMAPPARSTVEVKGLPRGAGVEIEVIATARS
jgi:2-iminobutanoate/2-iminopropanoate deaminase